MTIRPDDSGRRVPRGGHRPARPGLPDRARDRFNPFRVLLILRDTEMATALQHAMEEIGITVLGCINPTRRGYLLNWPALSDAALIEAKELAAMRRPGHSTLRRLASGLRLIVVVSEDRPTEIFGLPTWVSGLLAIDPRKGIDPVRIELALAGYCALSRPGLDRLLQLDWQSIVMDRLDVRERQVLGLLGDGTANRDIAAALKCSEARAKTLVRAVLDKLRIANRTKAGVLAARIAALTPPSRPRGGKLDRMPRSRRRSIWR